MSRTEIDSPSHALAAWGLSDAVTTPIEAGLINRTFLVTRAGERHVLQWVNPIFGAQVNEDIEAITAHLAQVGLTTPRLVRTKTGGLWNEDTTRGVWRLMTFVDGLTHHKATDPRLCESAGRLVGRFHRALGGFEYVFRHRRPHVHDTPRHRAHLAEVLGAHARHRAHAQVAELARELFARLDALPALSGLPSRIVHGDLKLSNLLFSPKGEALALIDLDTLALMSIPLELGDAWRSWCNPHAEDDAHSAIDLGLLESAVRGYAEAARGLLVSAELEALPVALETITLELAMRFSSDALEESYFGWDRARFPAACEHNLARARGQLALARSIATARSRIVSTVEIAFG